MSESEVKATQELVNVSEYMSEDEMKVLKNMEEELNGLIIGCTTASMTEEKKRVKLGVIMSFTQYLFAKAMKSSITWAGMRLDEDRMLLVAHDIVNEVRDELLADLQDAIASWCKYRAQIVATHEAKKEAHGNA